MLSLYAADKVPISEWGYEMKVQDFDLNNFGKKLSDSFTVVIDETNIHENNKPEFAAFAGMATPNVHLGTLRKRLLTIKNDFGYPMDLPIKYNFKKCERFRKHFKKEDFYYSIFELLKELDAKFFVNVVHSSIIRPGAKKSLKMNILITVITAEDFLISKNREGALVTDRMHYFERKDQARIFTDGVKFVTNERKLKMITSIAESHVDTHPLLQALDVVLGCFQNWINKPTPCFIENCLMEKLCCLLWTQHITGKAFEHGIKLRPLQLKSPAYMNEYILLETRLKKILSNVPKDETYTKVA